VADRGEYRQAAGAIGATWAEIALAQLRFEFFRFPIAAHPSKNCGERENDHSENVQTNSENKDKDKMHWKAFERNTCSTLLRGAYLRL
jgi:hypothetical protein